MEARWMRRRVSGEEVVKAAEKLRGSGWDEWAERHGDWSRDGAMHLVVRPGGLRLAEVVREVPGLRYHAAAQAVKGEPTPMTF